MSHINNIIVVGYPKSGNTWVTRLIAEVVECPVGGFYNSFNPSYKEIAIEGQDRMSSYKCYKSHHQLHELNSSPNDKIIYVVRDPRDVIISGANFFNFDHKLLISKIIGRNILSRGILKMLNKYFYSKKFKIQKMYQAVLLGSQDAHYWCRISWQKHIKPYMNAENVLIIRYEDLIDDSYVEMKKVLKHIGIEKNKKSVLKAIDKQSFKKKREKFLNDGDIKKAEFLRCGKSKQWIKDLSKGQVDSINHDFKKEMELLRYVDSALKRV